MLNKFLAGVFKMENARKFGQFTYRLSNNVLSKKDAKNFIYALGSEQLQTIGDTYLLDVFLSKDNCVELHYHPNASELTYCISGEAELGFLNMDTMQWENFVIERGEVVAIPQGWWHYACAKTNETHLLAIHDTDRLETIFGSDILHSTPNELLAHMYCLNEKDVERALSPIKDTVVIGPPEDCNRHDRRNKGLKNAVYTNRDIKERKEPKKEMERASKGKKHLFDQGLQTAFEMDEYRMAPSYASHHYMHPMAICPNCFGYR